MSSNPNNIQSALEAIQARTRYKPTVGLVLGSGLSELASNVQNPDIIPYNEIPGWPASTVVGHSGRLLIGQLEGQTVLVQQGRAHFYEGYTLEQIVLPARVMHQLGIKTLIVTNAAGGINPNFSAGDLMMITDHINFPGLAGNHPLRGPNDDSVGPRFLEMVQAYNWDLRKLAQSVAQANNIKLHEGTYAYVSGPTFETPAELRYLRLIGADAVGMSTVPTVIVAHHAGIRVLGISSITNEAITDPTPEAEISHEEVLEMGKIIVPKLTRLLKGILREL